MTVETQQRPDLGMPGQEVVDPATGPARPSPIRYARRLEPLYGAVVGLGLILLVLAAGYVRGSVIWPQEAALRESPYDDEGVYAAAAQLLVQNKHPYRDYIYAHAPLGPLLLTPGVAYHFTPWGSPTSYANLRYLMVVYSALTVGIAFLLAWRLWGLGGGLLSGALLALDPQSVWAGRHVMLEAPTLLLVALAALLYVLAREEEPAPAAALVGAGCCAAFAGGVKLIGLLLLAAFLLDLAGRRRWDQIPLVLSGVAIVWLPLAVYLAILRGGEPLNQFVWFQALRPPDGEIGLSARLGVLRREAWLTLLGAAFGLAALPIYRLRPVLVRHRRRRRKRGNVKLKTMSDLLASTEPRPSAPAPAPGPDASTTVETQRPPIGPGWSLLPWWVALALAALLFARSFYAHYTAHLTLPLAIVAGALPPAARYVLRSSWLRRVFGAMLMAVAIIILGLTGYQVAQDHRQSRQDRIYELVGRYAGDAAQPDESVFALDAQYPFRAARRFAREEHDRFVVDGYAMLLYHGLALEGQNPFELAMRALGRRPPPDPHEVMWRTEAQLPLRASLARSDLVVLDKASDARLTDETRDWLRTRARVLERQERYTIYRVDDPSQPTTAPGPAPPATPAAPPTPTAPSRP